MKILNSSNVVKIFIKTFDEQKYIYEKRWENIVETT